MDYCEKYRKGRLHPDKPDALVDFFITFLKKGASGLDAGCGEGRHTCYLISKSFHVIGIDRCEIAIKRAKRLCRGNFMVVDSTQLPFKDRTFDFVLDFAHLHTLRRKEQKRYISEVFRVLKPSGFLFVVCFSANGELCKSICPERRFNSGKKVAYAYFFTMKDIIDLLRKFNIVFLQERRVEGYNLSWVVVAQKP